MAQASDKKDVVEEEADNKMVNFSRHCRIFIGYINYDWDKDPEWTSF